MNVGGSEAEGSSAGPPPPLEWKFSQVFGERTAGEEVQEGLVFFFFFPSEFSLDFWNLGFGFIVF